MSDLPHIYRCDCDDCLNKVPLRIPGAGAVFLVRSRRGQLPPPKLELRESESVLGFSPELTGVRGE